MTTTQTPPAAHAILTALQAAPDWTPCILPGEWNGTRFYSLSGTDWHGREIDARWHRAPAAHDWQLEHISTLDEHTGDWTATTPADILTLINSPAPAPAQFTPTARTVADWTRFDRDDDLPYERLTITCGSYVYLAERISDGHPITIYRDWEYRTLAVVSTEPAIHPTVETLRTRFEQRRLEAAAARAEGRTIPLHR